MKIGNIFRSLGTEVIMVLAIGGMLLYMNASDLVVSFKPAISFQDMLDGKEVKAGSHVEGNVVYVLDYFASETSYTRYKDGSRSGGRKSGNYYLIPTAEGCVALKSRQDDVSVLDQLTDETVEYMTSGTEPTTEIFIEGHVAKLEGSVVKYYKEYLEEMGYTAEEVEAMGDPLVVEFRSFTAVRVMFVICIVLVILSVLLFRRRYRIATRGSGLRRAEDLPG